MIVVVDGVVIVVVVDGEVVIVSNIDNIVSIINYYIYWLSSYKRLNIMIVLSWTDPF